MRTSLAPAPEGFDEAAQVSRLLWGLMALTVAIAGLAAALAGVRFADSVGFLGQFALFLGVVIAAKVYMRFRGMGDARMRLCLDISAAFGLIALADLVIQYAAATVPAYPATALVLRADRALGFNWFDYDHYVSSVGPVWRTFRFCYGHWMAELVLAMAVLAYLRRYAAIGEFAIAFVLTGLTIIAIFTFVDVRSLESVAAYSLPGFHPPGGAGPGYLRALQALRSGADRTLDFGHISPLISFPSLHGATALLLAAATRGLGPWRYPFLAFNVLVLVSTLSEGGHDLTDVVAGGVVACAAMMAAAAIYRALPRGAGVRSQGRREVVDGATFSC